MEQVDAEVEEGLIKYGGSEGRAVGSDAIIHFLLYSLHLSLLIDKRRGEYNALRIYLPARTVIPSRSLPSGCKND